MMECRNQMRSKLILTPFPNGLKKCEKEIGFSGNQIKPKFGSFIRNITGKSSNIISMIYSLALNTLKSLVQVFSHSPLLLFIDAISSNSFFLEKYFTKV